MRRSGGDLDALKTARLAEIDAEAEALRLKLLTPGTGQAMVYAKKLREAELLLAHGLATKTPHLTAEAAVDGVTVFDKAREVIAADAAWVEASARIEAIRRTAKRSVKGARDLAAVRARVDWGGV